MAKGAVVHKPPQLDLNYDPEGDVLYVSFGPPQAADDSDLTDEGIIVHFKDEKLVGLTILNAKERLYNADLLKASQSRGRRASKRHAR